MKTPHIALDGIDGSGKSTQSKLLCTALTQAGIAHVSTREPGGTDLGLDIRAMLVTAKGAMLTPEAEVTLFSTDRNLTATHVTRPALEQGNWVVQDRSWLTTLMYQGYGDGVDLARIEAVTQLAVGDCRPALQLIMDLDPEVGLARKGKQFEVVPEGEAEDRFEKRGPAYFHRIRNGFRAEAARHNNIRLLDATLDRLALHRAVVEAVNAHFGTGLAPLDVLPSL
jgi:dTMP kinase